MQVRIAEGLLVDPRFKQLARLIMEKIPDILTQEESEELAIGKCWRAFHLAQKYWRDDRKHIPEDVWKLSSCASFASDLVEVGLAIRTEQGIYVSGAKAYFDWYHTKQEAGKLGGIESGKSRQKKKNNELGSELAYSEADEAEHSKHEPSSVSVSSSSSSSSSVPEDKKASPSARQLIEIWNANRGSLPEARLTKGREAKIKARLKEEPGLAYWETVVRKLAASDFTTGKNDRQWKADFTWLIKNDENHVKVSEGRYDNKGSTKPQPKIITGVADLEHL